jgi:hypothetical protein
MGGEQKLVKTDSSGRVTIGHPRQRYVLTEEGGGNLILTPISAAEQAALADPAVAAAIDRLESGGGIQRDLIEP